MMTHKKIASQTTKRIPCMLILKPTISKSNLLSLFCGALDHRRLAMAYHQCLALGNLLTKRIVPLLRLVALVLAHATTCSEQKNIGVVFICY